MNDLQDYISWFRRSSPYINAHRGRTFVVGFSGEAVADPEFDHLIHDLALLNSLGVQLVLVPGARPQIESRLKERGAELHTVNGLRVTDDAALACVKEAVGTVRVETEALLSMGVANSPMAGYRVQVASGNFVMARPLGVRDGVDYRHTGEVRRVDAAAIRERLAAGAVVLVSPLGYSPTGEVFNLYAEDVAFAVAEALGADKLLFLLEDGRLVDERGELLRELSAAEASSRLSQGEDLEPEVYRLLAGAVRACERGVGRVHLLERRIDGALLLELFTRDGVGSLISAGLFETLRQAQSDDVGGVLELVRPLEREGVLVPRSRALLETEIERFTVIERDGMIIGSAALSPLEGSDLGELACFAVHPDYRRGGRGDALLSQVEKLAREAGLRRLLVLTTRTAHWFQERGFEPAGLDDVPQGRRARYDAGRNARLFIKTL
ncbi:amino-acid N-acetyltransferase [Alkalilimnicola sp. S0819]|uniref:amino-acid N-acetyltransferase n=1 Tax=Alkalilimnicola sp. S0819 TaxID=2613922 RepID=UPI00126258DD|nr:amino-acid N-acetyltransferase [Alkalilimnicola sp. S0819]KAB7623011.1 amino-acid N-acetyltransferase [Alkalilimnicola sp. S0819]MPQ17123.1 amino-acid N-acetyltransferase [Alkalilimnicola sp. S0819]